MARTPDPTEEEFLDELPNVDNDPYAAQDELIQRLKLNLPARIATLNTLYGLSGDDVIRVPAAYRPAPAVWRDEFINTVSVGLSVEDEDYSPGLFKTTGNITVYSLEGRVDNSFQSVRSMWLRARAIRGVLYHFLNACRNADNVLVWQQLRPRGVVLLPSGTYWGVECRYSFVQVPGTG